MHCIASLMLPRGLQREEREPHKTHLDRLDQKDQLVVFPHQHKWLLFPPQPQKRIPRNHCLACLCISDAYTHELGPVLNFVTRNGTNYKYYSLPHTPISLPYQSLVNISYKRLLRGQLLPLLAAGKLGTQAYSFCVEQDGAGGPHPGEHYRNLMFYPTGSLRPALVLSGHLSYRPCVSSQVQIEKPGPSRDPSPSY